MDIGKVTNFWLTRRPLIYLGMDVLFGSFPLLVQRFLFYPRRFHHTHSLTASALPTRVFTGHISYTNAGTRLPESPPDDLRQISGQRS